MVSSCYVTAMSVCLQLYTVSQDGTLCVWESDTELDGLVLKKTPATTPRQEVDEEEEDRREGEEGEVIRGKAEAPREKKTKNVRYKQASKYEVSAVCFKFSLFQVCFSFLLSKHLFSESVGSISHVLALSSRCPRPVLVSSRHFFNKEGDFNNLTAAAYHKASHLLVTGFASGIFHLHELPEFNLIHSLR